MNLRSWRYLFDSQSREKANKIRNISGLWPKNLALYDKAFTHRSVNHTNGFGLQINYERLEFLGDAVLDLVVARELFKAYPGENEGFLTQMRSKLVNTKRLNDIGRRMGLDQLVVLDKKNKSLNMYQKGLLADTLEALIGAIYLDRGYKKAYDFIALRLLKIYVDMDTLSEEKLNHKVDLYEWAQKNNHVVRFEVTEMINAGPRKQFVSALILNGELTTKGIEYSKKAAEERAAEKFMQDFLNDNT
jgi:ribonuclease-3